MLYLTRKTGESLILGDGEIIFYIDEVKGNEAKIGIHAPNEMSIHREEIYKKLKKNSNKIPSLAKNKEQE